MFGLCCCDCLPHGLLLVSRQLEQQESKNSAEKAEVLRRLSGLQEENAHLSWDRASLAEVLKRTQHELELEKQASRCPPRHRHRPSKPKPPVTKSFSPRRAAQRKVSALERRTEACTLKRERTLRHMEAVLSVVDSISKERDQLLHMVLMLPVLDSTSTPWRTYLNDLLIVPGPNLRSPCHPL